MNLSAIVGASLVQTIQLTQAKDSRTIKQLALLGYHAQLFIIIERFLNKKQEVLFKSCIQIYGQRKIWKTCWQMATEKVQKETVMHGENVPRF